MSQFVIVLAFFVTFSVCCVLCFGKSYCMLNGMSTTCCSTLNDKGVRVAGEGIEMSLMGEIQLLSEHRTLGDTERGLPNWHRSTLENTQLSPV